MNLLLFNLKTDADDDVLGFTTDWINELARRFDHVFVITMMAGTISVAKNVSVFSVGKEKGYSEVRRLFEFYNLLRKILAKNEITACFAHMMPLFLMLAGPLLKLRGIRSVLWYTHKRSTWVLRLAYLTADRVVTASRESFPFPGWKVTVIGHGIDVARFRPTDNYREAGMPLILLTVGRITRVKRLEAVVEALSEHGKRYPGQNIRLEVVGAPLLHEDHLYLDILRGRIATLGLTDRVFFLGSKPNRRVEEHYRAADGFINLCDTGGVDKALLEAMSCGLPIVTSNATFREVLPVELADVWVVDSSKPVEVAERLDRLFRMKSDARALMGKRLREIVERGYAVEGLAARVKEELAPSISESRSPVGNRFGMEIIGK